jgi:hypothetical protein
MSSQVSLTDDEKRLVEEAIKQGKLVIVTRRNDAKISIGPKDKVVVIVKD